MESNESHNGRNRWMASLLGILVVLYIIHQRGKEQDELGRGIREGEGWFFLFLLWGSGVSAIAAFLQQFGVEIDIRVLSTIGMLPLFLAILRFLFADMRIIWLGALLVGSALILRLIIHLISGEPF